MIDEIAFVILLIITGIIAYYTVNLVFAAADVAHNMGCAWLAMIIAIGGLIAMLISSNKIVAVIIIILVLLSASQIYTQRIDDTFDHLNRQRTQRGDPQMSRHAHYKSVEDVRRQDRDDPHVHLDGIY